MNAATDLSELRDLALTRRTLDKDIETRLRRLVQYGTSFEVLGGALGVTGAAVRIKAKRKGWYRPGEPR